jgi:hypothetical protein
LVVVVGVVQELLRCTRTAIGLSRTLKKNHCFHISGGCLQMQKTICVIIADPIYVGLITVNSLDCFSRTLFHCT